MQLFPTTLKWQSFGTLSKLSKGRAPGLKTLGPTGPSMPKVKRFSVLGLYLLWTLSGSRLKVLL